MEEKKTLIILSPGFPADEFDSSCLPAQQALVRSINKIYPQINIIILSFQYPYTIIPYQWFGNTVIPFDGQNKLHSKNILSLINLTQKCKRLIGWIHIWTKLEKIRKQEKVIGLLSFWAGECAAIGYHFGRVKQIPHITWILGQDAKIGNRFMRLMRIKEDSLAAMSDFLAETFHMNYGIRPKQIIPNGIDTSLFSTQQVERDIDIIGVGSLIPLKRFDLFIQIIQKLILSFPDLKVMICGKGPEQNVLEELIHKLGLQKNIALAGEKKHEEVLRLMQRSRIMLHTSNYEGLSGACLEALYAGSHVVSFCRAQNNPIDHWHIVSNEDEMISKVIEVLEKNVPDHSSILPYPIDNSAKAMMQLFGI